MDYKKQNYQNSLWNAQSYKVSYPMTSCYCLLCLPGSSMSPFLRASGRRGRGGRKGIIEKRRSFSYCSVFRIIFVVCRDYRRVGMSDLPDFPLLCRFSRCVGMSNLPDFPSCRDYRRAGMSNLPDFPLLCRSCASDNVPHKQKATTPLRMELPLVIVCLSD